MTGNTYGCCVLLLAVTVFTGCEAPPQPNSQHLVVFLVRHAEKVDNSADAELSAAGKQRSETLARILRDADLEFVHSTDFIRTKDTVSPVAAEFDLAVELYNSRDQTAFAEQLRNRGGHHLVVGHSNTLPPLVEILTGESTAAFGEQEYDRLYIITIGSGGDPSLVLLRYGALDAE